MPKQGDDSGQTAKDEVERRRDDAIRRALNTPPIPLKKFVGRSTKDNSPTKRKARKRSNS